MPLTPRRRSTGVQLFMNYVSFAVSATMLGPFFCRGAFDVVFVHEPSPITVGIPAVLIRWLKRAPVLFWVLDLWPESLSATGAIRSERVLSWVEAVVRYIYRLWTE